MNKKRLEREKELKECVEGNCPYKNHLYAEADMTCAPFSGGCSSGVNERGEVYCDRLRALIHEG